MKHAGARPGHWIAAFAIVVAAFVLLLGAGKAAPTPKMFAEKLTYAQASERAAREGKPVFAVFSAAWCGPCQAYKRVALSDARVEQFVKEKMVATFIDVDKHRDVAKKFNISSIPATQVIRNDKRVQGAIGAIDADRLLALLEEAVSKPN